MLLSEIDYQDRKSIEKLLGAVGQQVLDRVLQLAYTVSEQCNWPLTKVQVQHYKDI